MSKKLISFSIMALFLLGLTTAVSVDFFYHPECQHCQKVVPTIQQVAINNPQSTFNAWDTSQGSYNVDGVPTIKIKTSDNRKIVLTGSQEIPRWFECEVNEMTTKNCPTYSATKKLECDASLFVR